MLTNLRERSQRSFGVLILFGMLTFIFIFFFGPQSEGCQPQQASTSLEGWAARVNDVELSRREVENLVYLRGDRRSEAELKSLRQDILLGLVDQELLAQRGAAVGIAIDERGLSRYITSDENPDFIAFTDDAGNFDSSGFRDALRYRLGISPDDYRLRKKREYLANQYRRFLEEQIQVSAAEIKAEVEKDLRSWNLNYLKFGPEQHQVDAPTASAVTAYVSDKADSIKAFYNQNKAKRFVKGREVKARRILIKKPADDAGIKSARAKIEMLHAKASAQGANFAQLATENSEGAGDKEKAGDMGFIRPGAAFYKKVFEPLKVGEVSGIQDESIGLFFVKAEAEMPAVNRTIEMVSQEIAREMLVSETQTEMARDAANKALVRITAGATLEDASKAPVAVAVEPVAVTEGSADTAKPAKAADRSTALFAETGPITDNTRFGQPWDRIPTLGKRALGARSELVARQLRSLTPAKPLIGEVVEVEGEFYIFSLKSKTEGKADEITAKLEEKKTQMLALRRRQMVYGEIGSFGGDPLATFRKALRSGNKVEINEELYPQPKVQQSSGLPPGLKLKLDGAKK
jgi:parvulin-like peptidyl-prolyl isomerase